MARLYYHREVFYSVMQLSDFGRCGGASYSTFERHISGESFTAKIALSIQRPIFGLLHSALQGVVSQKEKKIARNLNLHLQFKANLKWAGRQLVASVRLVCPPSVDQRSHPQKRTDFRHRIAPHTAVAAPVHLEPPPRRCCLYILPDFFRPRVIMLILGCRLLMAGWFSVILSAIYRRIYRYLEHAESCLDM